MKSISKLNRVRLGRLLTELQDNPKSAREILARQVFQAKGGYAHVVGITGAVGSGKSTLISQMLPFLRREGRRIVVLAIDPSSARSGGALLGDRIRMRDLYLDPGVFIRSLATRGAPGALTVALPNMIEACRLFCDTVIIETAGSGQSDLQVHRLVHTLVVVLAPLGDAITLMKSGQADFAHIVAVNMREGVAGGDRFAQEASVLLAHASTTDDWERKVFPVNAKTGEGVEPLVQEGILGHARFLGHLESELPFHA